MQRLNLAWGMVFVIFAVPTVGVGGDNVWERQSLLADQQEVSVTIYNNNLALVRELRSAELGLGENHLALRDVSMQLRPETAQIRNFDAPQSLTVLEQSFDNELLSPQKLLEKNVGREVQLIRAASSGGEEQVATALVLSADGPVLKIGDRIEAGVPGRIIYKDVPRELRDRPTLVTTLQSSVSGAQRLELTYLTGGLSWRVDYVAQLSARQNECDLSAWVTIDNQSDATFPDAKVQLVAGDINQVQEAMPMLLTKAEVVRSAAPESSNMPVEGLFDYHLYRLERPTTLRAQQRKQVALFSTRTVPFNTSYELHGQDYYYAGAYGVIAEKVKIGTWVGFENREQSHLGIPLPKGVVRVYKQDAAGHPLFVGEDRLEHTAKNEAVRLFLGSSFDLGGSRTQIDFKQLPRTNRFSPIFESAYRIVLRNAGELPATIDVIEPLPGDWEIVSENLPHRKDSAKSAVWSVPVPAAGEKILEYRVQVRFPASS